MTQPTDTQLKQALAKMLPANTISLAFAPELYWLNAARHETDEVLDTELLHLCWMVEETLDRTFWGSYVAELYDLTDAHNHGYCPNHHWLAVAHASWQQRTIALCKVKGVEIV
jgi:hypothetical protein